MALDEQGIVDAVQNGDVNAFNAAIAGQDLQDVSGFLNENDLLIVAAETGNGKLVEALARAGADPFEQSDDGRTVFDFIGTKDVLDSLRKGYIDYQNGSQAEVDLSQFEEAAQAVQSRIGLAKGGAHAWKEALSQFDRLDKDADDYQEKAQVLFERVFKEVEGDVFLLPKQCFDYYLDARNREADKASEEMTGSQGQFLRALNSGLGSLERKEHKSLGAKIDRAIFALKKNIRYALEEIKDYFTNPGRGGAKFLAAVNKVFSAIKTFFKETIPNFAERAWSHVRENVLIPFQAKVDLTVSHVNEAIAKGFQPKYVSIGGPVHDAYEESRDVTRFKRDSGIADEKLKRAMQGLSPEDRELVKEIQYNARGASKRKVEGEEVDQNILFERQNLRNAAAKGGKEAVEAVVRQIREVRESQPTSRKSQPDSARSSRRGSFSSKRDGDYQEL